MIKLLKGIVILLVVLFAAYFLLIDGLIKTQLESAGSRALQARLEIGKLTFHIFPTSLTLQNVQISAENFDPTQSGDTHAGGIQEPARNLVQAEKLSLPLSLRDLLAHKLLIDGVDIQGLRFNRLRAGEHAVAPASTTTSATRSPQLREALQHIRSALDNPLANHTIGSNTSIAGALLGGSFKPLLNRMSAALNMLAVPTNITGDWKILIRRVNIDGALDFGTQSLRFSGTINNVTPQPQFFDVVTQFDIRNVGGESATLHASGSLDKRKLAQATMRFDLSGFPLSQWSLCNDPELKITVVSAKIDMQVLLSMTGNQFDLSALTHFQQAHIDVSNGNDDIARTSAEVWRQANTFDINLQASGALNDPVLKLNSSLDAPLAAAMRQLQSTSAFPQALSQPTSP